MRPPILIRQEIQNDVVSEYDEDPYQDEIKQIKARAKMTRYQTGTGKPTKGKALNIGVEDNDEAIGTQASG